MGGTNTAFDELRNYLHALPFSHCIVYRVVTIGGAVELKRFKAASPYISSAEEYDRLADSYLTLVSSFIRQDTSAVLREGRRLDLGGKEYEALAPPEQTMEGFPPENSAGQRWWHLVIGDGATRDAGYAIVAQVAARNEQEVGSCIAEIQRIIGKWSAESEGNS
jgi:hypothetical protein